jgi:hypothetical protein
MSNCEAKGELLKEHYVQCSPEQMTHVELVKYVRSNPS